MGSSKTTNTTDTTTKATPTPEEQEMEKLQLEQYKQIQPGQTQAQLSGLNLTNQLLTGSSPLPGFFGTMAQGISPEAIGTQAAQMGRQAMPGYQQLGILDSGEAQRSISSRIANELLFPAQQFNIGALQNLLNIALSGQAQVQAPIQNSTNTLASQLAGLRSTTTNQQQTYTPSFMQNMQMGMQGVGQMSSGIGGFMTGMNCWVASEIFGGWFKPKTCMARYYISNLAPDWFRNFYYKYGERIARFIHNKPIFKIMLRPLFEYFAYKGGRIVWMV